MTAIDKLAQLHEIISREFSPLIDRGYRLLEMPDDPNIGDVLISKDEMNFLRTLPVECKEMLTMASFAGCLPAIPEDEMLICSGSGYFGDLWTAGPGSREKIFAHYPNNPKPILSPCAPESQESEEFLSGAAMKRKSYLST